MNKLNTLIILFALINFYKQDVQNWTVKELYNTITLKENQKNYIIDPNSYLSVATKASITEKMSKITKEKNYNNILIIINSINQEYNKDITKFSELLIFDLFNKEIRENTILVIYSIEDRIYRIRTGSLPRKIFTDKSTANLAEYFKSYLKVKKYDEGFDNLFDNIDKCISGESNGCNPNYWASRIFWGIFGSILLIFGGICVYQYFENQKKKKIQDELREKFKTIKELKESKPDAVLFIQENCVICLENLTKENGELEKGNELREIVLKCGHNFHEGCIKDWLKTKEKCPICRENAFFEEERNVGSQRPLIENRRDRGMNNNVLDGMDLTNFLYQIQRERYEQEFNRSQMDDMYHNNTWSWVNYDKNHGNSGGNRGFSIDTGAGGTTGSW